MSRNQRKFIALREWAATVKANWAHRADLVADLNEEPDKREGFDLSDVRDVIDTKGGPDGR